MGAPITLSIDCGGGGIKASALDAAGTMIAPVERTPTPYPLPPELLIEIIAGLAAKLPVADRVTVGMPGMIRHGVVISTPHYVTRSGPRTKPVSKLVHQWSGFDMRRRLAGELDKPVIVLNDAEVHGAGVIIGSGLELILTLGTGLGNALFDGGRLAPHQEISRAPIRWGLTYDEYLGEHERIRLGDAHWSRRVRAVIDHLRPVYLWDRLYIGGGNSRRMHPTTVAKMSDDVVIVPNSAGIVGGVRAWDLPRWEPA